MSKLEKTLKELSKRFGKENIKMANEVLDIETISTGAKELDEALEVGGYPTDGRVIEIYGKEASGKTTLALYAVKEFQKAGENTVYIDMENSINMDYVKKLGVDTEKMVFAQPQSGEQAMKMVEQLILSDDVGLIVIDSVTALTPEAEIEGEVGDSHMALLARLMSQTMRKFVGIALKNKTTLMFINQIRTGMGGGFSYNTTTGGNALKFYASIRLKLSIGSTLQRNKEKAGHKLEIEVVKNKVGKPGKKVAIPLIWGEGFNG